MSQSIASQPKRVLERADVSETFFDTVLRGDFRGQTIRITVAVMREVATDREHVAVSARLVFTVEAARELRKRLDEALATISAPGDATMN